jgi:tRNA 2-thiocytidine biosynthesis protein TtcA
MQPSEKIFKKICRKVGTTMRDHEMIRDGDRLLVALSGGKDSMILLEALAERKWSMPVKFDLEAVHVEARGIGYRVDISKMESFCSRMGVPFHVRAIQPDLEKDPEKGACFVCSWHRRKALFDMTREMNFNGLALGHHRNDAIETLLMNMIYHGSVSSLPYTLKMFGGRVRLIRPLMDIDERILREYAALNDLVRVDKNCPHEDRSKREKIRGIIGEIESLYGKGPYNMFRAMDKICMEYLPGKEKSQD